MISMLEKRRREARAHDEIQRQAEERAAKARREPAPRRQLPAPVHRQPMSGQDLLAALLVRDGRSLVTTAELRAVIEYVDQQLEELWQLQQDA